MPNTDPKLESPRAVTDYFSDHAADWENHYAADHGYAQRFFAERLRLVLKLLGPVKDERVLDLGCASGDYARLLGNAGAAVTGMDLVPAMVGRARNRSRSEAWDPAPAFVTANGMALPFGDAQFDRVICIGVIQYIPDPERALAEVARVLKPGGRFVLTSPNPISPVLRTELAISRVAGWFRQAAHGQASQHRTSPSHMEQLLGRNRLQPVDRAFCSYLPYNIGIRLPAATPIDKLLSGIQSRLGLAWTGAAYVLAAERAA